MLQNTEDLLGEFILFVVRLSLTQALSLSEPTVDSFTLLSVHHPWANWQPFCRFVKDQNSKVVNKATLATVHYMSKLSMIILVTHFQFPSKNLIYTHFKNQNDILVLEITLLVIILTILSKWFKSRKLIGWQILNYIPVSQSACDITKSLSTDLHMVIMESNLLKSTMRFRQ